MQMKKDHAVEPDKKTAGVCGLYCEACTLFIATKEDPERLGDIAKRYLLTVEAITCYGCRSAKRGPYCEKCKMFACAAQRGIDFCVECTEYPCDDLKQFQSEGRPHRLELWDDLEQIRTIGYKEWLKETRENYTCPRCESINSAYDLKCRKCGEEPSCSYVAGHKQEIEWFLKNP